MNMHCVIKFDKWNWMTFAKTFQIEDDLSVANCEDKIIWVPKCMGFLSKCNPIKPYVKALHFIDERKKMMDPNVQSYYNLFTQKMPIVKGGTMLQVMIGKQLITLKGQKCNTFPSNGRSLEFMMTHLRPETIIEFWRLMMLESHILLIGDNVNEITLIEDAIMSLLYPLSWVLVFLPLLPVGLTEYIQAPLPFLIGIQKALFNAMTVTDNDTDLYVIDINTSEVKCIPSGSDKKKKKKQKDAMALPRIIIETLYDKLTELAKLYSQNKKSYDKYYMQKLFVDSLIYLIKGYEDITTYLLDSIYIFDSKAFISSKPKKEKQFYSAFINTQCFKYFLERHERKENQFYVQYYERYKNKTIYASKESSSTSGSSFEERRNNEKYKEYSLACGPELSEYYYYFYPKAQKSKIMMKNDYIDSNSKPSTAKPTDKQSKGTLTAETKRLAGIFNLIKQNVATERKININQNLKIDEQNELHQNQNMMKEYINCIFLSRPLVGADLQNFSWLLKNEHNRHYLIKHLQQPKFRKGKIHLLKIESSESLSTILNVALIECDRNNDFNCAYLFAKLSEHYYYIDDEAQHESTTKYLISSIRDHNLWKKPEFWKYVFAYKCEKILFDSALQNKEDEIVNIITDIIHLMCTLHMDSTIVQNMIAYLGKISEISLQDMEMLKKLGMKLLKNIMLVDEGEVIF